MGRDTWAPLRAPVVTWAVLAGGTALLALRSPHVPGSYGVCPVYAVTGLYCAGCGVLRATHDLAHLDLASAWAMNPVWVLAVPAILLALGWWTWQRVLDVRALRAGRRRPARPALSSTWAYLALAGIVAYSVLRNVPALAPWLVPGVP